MLERFIYLFSEKRAVSLDAKWIQLPILIFGLIFLDLKFWFSFLLCSGFLFVPFHSQFVLCRVGTANVLAESLLYVKCKDLSCILYDFCLWKIQLSC